MRMNKGKPFTHVQADTADAPTFSESFLYETVGKGDARFILGVADEYEHVIDALGPAAVRAILDVRPRLAQRLGTGKKIVEWLEDARSDDGARRDEEFPPQVILDSDAVRTVWRLLHNEYRRYFDPENDLDPDLLRTYHYLTDNLGEQEQGERRKEQERLPEKLKKKQERKLARLARERAREPAAPDGSEAS